VARAAWEEGAGLLGQLLARRRDEFFPRQGGWNELAAGSGNHFRETARGRGHDRKAGGKGLDDDGRAGIEIFRMEQDVMASIELRRFPLGKRS
jgi:hypothetical protein